LSAHQTSFQAFCWYVNSLNSWCVESAGEKRRPTNKYDFTGLQVQLIQYQDIVYRTSSVAWKLGKCCIGMVLLVLGFNLHIQVLLITLTSCKYGKQWMQIACMIINWDFALYQWFTMSLLVIYAWKQIETESISWLPVICHLVHKFMSCFRFLWMKHSFCERLPETLEFSKTDIFVKITAG